MFISQDLRNERAELERFWQQKKRNQRRLFSVHFFWRRENEAKDTFFIFISFQKETNQRKFSPLQTSPHMERGLTENCGNRQFSEFLRPVGSKRSKIERTKVDLTIKGQI